jgi:hypothetical protein
MDNPNVYTLAALQISAALPQSLLTPAADLDGMSAVSLDVKFGYGAGSGTVSVIVVTSFDGGSSLRHIARFEFANADAVKTANLSGLVSKGITAYADLSAEGVNDGLLGDMLAVLLTTTGSYTDSTLSVRASVR